MVAHRPILHYLWVICEPLKCLTMTSSCRNLIQLLVLVIRIVAVSAATLGTCPGMDYKLSLCVNGGRNQIHAIEMLHSTKKPVTTMLTYPWKCTVLHCNHLLNTWKPLVLMTRHFDYCPSASEGDNQSVRSSAPVVSRCFPGGYNVKLYISRGRLAWWLLAFLHSASWVYSQILLPLFGVP